MVLSWEKPEQKKYKNLFWEDGVGKGQGINTDVGEILIWWKSSSYGGAVNENLKGCEGAESCRSVSLGYIPGQPQLRIETKVANQDDVGLDRLHSLLFFSVPVAEAWIQERLKYIEWPVRYLKVTVEIMQDLEVVEVT